MRATHELGGVDLMRTNESSRLEQARDLAVAAGAVSLVTTLDLQLAASAYLRLDAEGCVTAARRSQHSACRFGPELVFAEAIFAEAVGHAIAGRETEMEHTLERAQSFDRPEADLQSIGAAHRGVYALLHEEREQAIGCYDAAMAALRASPTVYVRPSGHWWALLHAVTDRTGAAALTEMRARTAGSGLTTALLCYGDAIEAGRAADPRAADLFAEARSHVASPGLAAQRHLAERHVAECALTDQWGEPISWLADAAAFFHTTGHRHVEQACRALLRRAGVPMPVRNQTRVPAHLAALGITDRECEVLTLVIDGMTSREIAARLYLSVRTVDKHVELLLAKTGVARRVQLRRLRT
jgi:DNA-binding CsgD family transcriptional regulator